MCVYIYIMSVVYLYVLCVGLPGYLNNGIEMLNVCC